MLQNSALAELRICCWPSGITELSAPTKKSQLSTITKSQSPALLR